MEPMTPENARRMMPSHQTDGMVEKVNEAITRAAKGDKTEARVDFLGVVVGDKFTLSTAGGIVAKKFRDQGFRFKDVYECRQFVDVGYKIIWDENK